MRLITLNGVKLLVYRNGMILRYSEMNRYQLIKGWSEVKGNINNVGYVRIRLNGKSYKKHRIVGYAFLGLDLLLFCLFLSIWSISCFGLSISKPRKE